MCGIAGVAACIALADSDRQDVVEMLAQIVHRGPENTSVVQPDPRVVLGHDRLSIIDLDQRSNQPLCFENAWLSYNGEVYNYRELRAELQGLGADFQTQSDTEVVLAAYRAWGDEFVKRLDGMFAFCLLDACAGRILLARDRLGKKPLYYTETLGRLHFASEIKAFRTLSEWQDRRLDVSQLGQLLEYNFAERLTPFESVRELPPGSTLAIDLDTGTREERTYFSLVDLVDEAEWARLDAATETSLVDELEDLLTNAVRKRLIADVPVCSINSGGLDSSLVSALAARHTDVEMFHIDVAGDSERRFAEIVAAHLGLPLRVVPFGPAQSFQRIVSAIDALESPLGHQNNTAVALLAESIHLAGYKVVLGGEVADEAFGGYPHQRRVLTTFSRPAVLSGVADLRRLGETGPGLMLRRLLAKVGHPVMSQRMATWHTAVDAAHIREFDSLLERYGFVADAAERSFSALCLFDLGHYLRPLLMRSDKLFMMHSVESRLPFADMGVLRFAVNLPARFRTDKLILRKLAERYLPLEAVYRPKNGFRVTIPGFADLARADGVAPEAEMFDLALAVLQRGFSSRRGQ